MRPEEFILTTDFATLKNDVSGQLSVSLPNTLNIANGGIATYIDTIELGQLGSSIRSRVMSTKDNNWYTMSTVQYQYLTGATVGGTPGFGYQVNVSISRITPTSIRLFVFIANGYGANMSITGLAQTITARVTTFLPPFSV